MHTYLTQKKLKSCSIDEARVLMDKGAVLLDVRLAVDYENQHAQGAKNVPLFRITAGNSQWDTIKKVVMAGLNMKATERDPDFVKNVDALVQGKKRTKIIVMCAIGGTLDTVVKVASTGKITKTDKDRSFGRESRSLKACYELMRAGYTNVIHMEGGFSQWRHQGIPWQMNDSCVFVSFHVDCSNYKKTFVKYDAGHERVVSLMMTSLEWECLSQPMHAFVYRHMPLPLCLQTLSRMHHCSFHASSTYLVS